MSSASHKPAMQMPADYLPPQILHQDHSSLNHNQPMPENIFPLHGSAGHDVQASFHPETPFEGPAPPQKAAVMFKQVQPLQCPPPRLLASKSVFYRKLRPQQQQQQQQQTSNNIPCSSTGWFRGRIIEMLIEDSGSMSDGIYAGDILELREHRLESHDSTPVVHPMHPNSTMFYPFAPPLPSMPSSQHQFAPTAVPGSSPMRQVPTQATPASFDPEDFHLQFQYQSDPPAISHKFVHANNFYDVSKKSTSRPLSNGRARGSCKQNKALRTLLTRMNEVDVAQVTEPKSIPVSSTHDRGSRLDVGQRFEELNVEASYEERDAEYSGAPDGSLGKPGAADEYEPRHQKPQLDQVDACAAEPRVSEKEGSSKEDSFGDYICFDGDINNELDALLNLNH